jgi:hypothetical protein
LLFNHPKHITHILHQNACGVVQIALSEAWQAGAGQQVEVVEGGL